jgi:hypothetical protein
MLLSDSSQMQLGAGRFSDALQTLDFINLNKVRAVAISDGVSRFSIPAVGRVNGQCVAGDGDQIYIAESLRKYWTPGSTFTAAPVFPWIVHTGLSMVLRLDGALVLSGGRTGELTGAQHLNDVWVSANGGISWALLTSAAAWSGRRFHQMVVRLDGALVLAGGEELGGAPSNSLNDVWMSSDGGSAWSELTSSASWDRRSYFAMVVRTDGALVLAGGRGFNDVYRNEVWMSADGGSTWSALANSASWSAHGLHAMVVRLDGALVLSGGYNSAGPVFQNDVWMSADGGGTWSSLVSAASWDARYGHTMIMRSDGALVTAGGSGENAEMRNDIWISVDGGSIWTSLALAAQWSERVFHAMVVRADGAIVLAGGHADSEHNDGWISVE